MFNLIFISMDYKGLWEESQPMKVFEVIDYCYCDREVKVSTIICKSYLEAHFVFKEIVDSIKEGYEEDWDNYTITEREDYFSMKDDRPGGDFKIEITIEKQEVYSFV